MHLTLDTIPRSFTAQALDCIYRNHTLNPPFDPDAHGFIHTTAKVVRCVIRGVCWIPITLLCAPTGMAYHLVAAAFYKVRSWTIFQGNNYTSYMMRVQRASALAFEHFKLFFLELPIGNLNQNQREIRKYSHIVAYQSSGTPVQIDHILESRDNEDVLAKVRFEYETELRRETFQKERGFWQYQFRAKRLYNYDALVQSANELRERFRKNFALNDRCVLQHVHRLLFQNRYDNFRPFRVERVNLQEVQRPQGMQSKPAYTTPWKAIGWCIVALALAAISLYVFKRFKLHGQEFRLASLFAATVLIPLEQAQKAYIKHYGQAELECAHKAPSGEKHYWYFRAAMGGYAEAQRAYGLYLLILAKRPKEGLDLIYAAAVNGDSKESKLAKDDLNALLKNDNDLFPLWDIVFDENRQPQRRYMTGDTLGKEILIEKYIEVGSQRYQFS